MVTVQDHAPLHRGTIYVVPSNHYIEITDHDVTVLPDGPGRPKPPMDLLLRSAVCMFSEQLIAVILTGTGSDGTLGVVAVKAAGGILVIQKLATAAYPGMPKSLAPHTVRSGPVWSAGAHAHLRAHCHIRDERPERPDTLPEREV